MLEHRHDEEGGDGSYAEGGEWECCGAGDYMGSSILLERKLNVVLVWGRGARVSGS